MRTSQQLHGSEGDVGEWEVGDSDAMPSGKNADINQYRSDTYFEHLAEDLEVANRMGNIFGTHDFNSKSKNQ